MGRWQKEVAPIFGATSIGDLVMPRAACAELIALCCDVCMLAVSCLIRSMGVFFLRARDGGGEGGTQFVHGRSRMAIDPRIPTLPERSTSGFHQPGRHCLHQGGGGEDGHEEDRERTANEENEKTSTYIPVPDTWYFA